MVGSSKFKSLFILFGAVVMSIVACNFLLYHKNYYGPVPFLVASTTALSRERSSVHTQLMAKLDMNFEHITQSRSEGLNIGKLMNSLAPLQETFVESTSSPLQEKIVDNVSSPLHHSNQIIISNKTTDFTYSKDKPTPDSSSLKNTTALGVNKSASGYILALKIYEQQTMATGNLLQLQCFASKLNFSVVQPSMEGSCLNTPLDSSQRSEMLQMEDVFNMQEWRQHTLSKGYTSLVRWEEFIKDAPKDLILVQMKYPTLTHLRAIRDSGKPFPHPVSERKDYEQGCGYKYVDQAFGILKKRGFRAIRKVCYNFFSGDEIPLEVYRGDLGGRDPNSVTVIIDEWRGFGENQRVLIEEKICPDSNSYREHVSSSSRVVRDAQRYVDKYLPHANTTGYLAVIGRYEMTALTRRVHIKNNSDPHAVIYFCLQETMKQIESMRRGMGGGVDTFLSMDIGKYGSKSFVKHGYYGHQRDMEKFVSDVYRNEMNLTDWERTFETVVVTPDAGYIAKVQQAIVARAKCVLFVGGGTFQKHTLHLYQQLHPDPPDRCVRIIEKCTSASRPIQ